MVKILAQSVASSFSDGMTNSSLSFKAVVTTTLRSEEHTSELQSPCNLVCRLLLEKKTRNQSALKTHRCSPRLKGRLLNYRRPACNRPRRYTYNISSSTDSCSTPRNKSTPIVSTCT